MQSTALDTFYRQEGMITCEYEPRGGQQVDSKADMRFLSQAPGYPAGFHIEYGKVMPPGAHHSKDDRTVIRYADSTVAMASSDSVREHFIREALAALQ